MAKSTKPMASFFDIETGEEIVRELNDEEFAQWQADQATNQAAAEAKAKAEADKAVLLARLGLTEDEAKLLLS
jgi:hypothetical protein